MGETPYGATLNILTWILQFLLAAHTVIGAVWKLSNSAEQTMPSLKAIPNELWLALAVFEVIFAAGLVFPAFKKSLMKLAPLAAAGIAAEMLLFCGLHLASGDTTAGPMVYWIGVAAVCAMIVYGRRASSPLKG